MKVRDRRGEEEVVGPGEGALEHESDSEFPGDEESGLNKNGNQTW